MKRPIPMIRVGMIGAGRMALWHLRAYSAMNDVSIVGIANPVSDRGSALAARYSIAAHATDYRKILDLDGLDAVDICAPIALHKEIVFAALEHGLHIYCEKPLCPTVADLDAVISLNRLKKRIIFNGFNLRHCREFQKIKKIVDSGELGEIRFISISRTTLASSSREAHIIMELSTHYLDLLDWWGLGEPERIYASGGSVLKKNNPDTVVINIDYASGATAVLINSLGIPGLCPEITIAGSQKVLHLRYGKILLETQRCPQSMPMLLLDALKRGCVLPFRIMRNPFNGSCRHFIDCVASGTPSPHNEVTARAAIHLAELAIQSDRLKTPIIIE